MPKKIKAMSDQLPDEIAKRKRANLPKAYKKKSTGRPYFDKEALVLWSLIVRLRAGGCELCNTDATYDKHERMVVGLDAHHIVGRTTYKHRYTLNNGMALCYGCHQFSKEHSPHLDYTSQVGFDKRFSEDEVFKYRYQWWDEYGHIRGQCEEGAQWHYYRLLDVFVSLLDGESAFPGEAY